MENKLLLNYLFDLKKQEMFDKLERAAIITRYLKENDMSQRELGRELGIPHSTIQDWCMWHKLDRKRYDDLIQLGYNERDIYRSLRSNKCQKTLPIEKASKDLKMFREFDFFIRSNVKNIEDNLEIRNLIRTIKNNLNRVEMYYDKRKL